MTRFIIFGLPIAFLTACAPAADSYTSQKSSASETSVSRSDFTWPRSYEYMPEGATLIFSATADWRHDSGIAGASAFWARESDENGSGIFTTEHPGVFTAENLSKFDVIIMNSASGNVLSGDQQTAIRQIPSSKPPML